jgi:spermidine/putrescine transport system ATP-binding protein
MTDTSTRKPEPLVVFERVVKRYDAATAVKGIDLTIHRGEFLAIMGPSGCGKTTTLRMLAGLETPSEGEIRLDGRRINELSPSVRNTPLVWQSLALFPFLNARENVEFGLKMRGLDKATRRAKAMDWLGRLGIAELAERPVDKLSGGQRQRVALARSLVTEPPILLLDEPLSALDAHLVIRMQGVLTRLQRELGITFVYVTHSQSEALAMADRVVIMSQGEISQIGPPREIYRAPANRFVAEFVGRNNLFEGRFIAGHDGSALVETPLGRFPVPAMAAAPPGSTVGFVVAADRVRVGRESDPGRPSIPCRLISEEFVGATITLYLEAADGRELKAQITERDLAAIDPKADQQFYMSWSMEDVHVLPQGLST